MQKLITEQMRAEVEKEKQKMIYQMKADVAAAAGVKLQSSSHESSSMVLYVYRSHSDILYNFPFFYYFTALPVISCCQNTWRGKPDHPDFKTFSQAFTC